uniref:Metalloendopeptidase n=1 Tax=Strongyloides papillosus TaxID=174720 RepID=A0A0N5BZ64_STREA
MKRLELLFLIILVYFTITNNSVLSKKPKKKKPSKTPTNSFVMNKTIEYSIQKTLKYAGDIRFYHGLFENETCINFIESDVASLITATLIKWGDKCSVSADLVGGDIAYTINVNKECNDRDRFLKLIYWSVELRYQFTKCLESDRHYRPGHIKEHTMQDVLKKYKCKIDALGEAEQEINRFQVIISIKKSPKKSGVEPADLEQRDYNKELSFNNLIYLNKQICSNSCKDKKYSRKKCYNYGFKKSKNCYVCICPFFYTGKYCKDYMKPKKTHYCPKSYLKSSSTTKTLILDLKAECYYIIKPSSTKYKKVKVKFEPIGNPIHWKCSLGKILEVKYKKDKSIDGVMPCGHMRNFTVTADKGTTVLVYHDRIGTDFQIKMEYKEIRA